MYAIIDISLCSTIEIHRIDILIYILINLKYATIYNNNNEKKTFKLFNYVFSLSIVI